MPISPGWVPYHTPTCRPRPSYEKRTNRAILFLFQNYQLYKIKYVDAGKKPALYGLVDLMDAPIPGYYYKQQLTRGKEPAKDAFFRMEGIVKSKVENGKVMHLIKYLHYPAKFNRWVYENDMLK